MNCRRPIRYITFGLIAFLSTAYASAGAIAEDPGFWKNERLTLRVGGFYAFLDTDAQVNGSNGLVGTAIDFESQLNLDDKRVQPFGELTWRMGKKHRIDLSYLSLHRDAIRSLSATINFGETAFTVGTSVRSEFDLDILRLSYGYSFIHNEKLEVGALVGLHAARTKLGITGLGGLGLVEEAEQFILPLPSAGLYASYRVHPRIKLKGRAQIFILEVDQYRGELYNLGLGVEYDISRRWSLGLAYEYFEVDFKSSGEFVEGGVQFVYHGPAAYVGFRF